MKKETYLKLKKISLDEINSFVNILNIGDKFSLKKTDNLKKGNYITYLEVINIKKNSVEYIIKTEKLE